MAVVLILIAVMIGTSGGNTGSTSTDTYIETVQNGYLGEFTDMTVQELLSSCYEDQLGCTAEWDGGENDDGQQIVEVNCGRHNDSVQNAGRAGVQNFCFS